MNSIILKKELQKFWDSKADNYEGMPKNIEDSAKKWMEAFKIYYLTMFIPLPGLSNSLLMTSLSIFEENLLSSIQSKTIKENLADLIENLHYGVIKGIDIINIYRTIYPPYKLYLDDCFLNNSEASIICEKFSIKIDAWIRSTYSIQINSGVVFPWI